MWIQIRAKDGETLDAIAKRFKNRDPKAILNFAGNKKIAAKLKKGEGLAGDTLVWVLDPKGKVYLIKTAKGQQVLSEAEYKDLQKRIHKKMDEFLERQRINYNYAVDRHDAQIKINEDQWFVSSVVETFNSVPEPDWKRAQTAYRKLKGVVSKRDYKGFAAAALVSEKEIAAYTNGVHAWCNGLIDTAEGTVTVLEGVKTVGAFCGALAVVTVAAPATLGAAMVWGGVSSAGVGLAYDSAENVGLAANDMKTRSLSELGNRMLVNGVTGALAAGILFKAMPLVKGPLVKAISNNAFLKAQAQRLGASLGSKVYEKEFEIALKKVVPEMVKKGTIHISLVESRVLTEAATKFLLRAGNSMLHKALGTKKGVEIVESVVLGWIKSAPKELKSKDGKGVGEAATKAVLKSGKVDSLFDQMFSDNMAEFRKVLQEVLQAHIEREAKKVAA